MISYLIPPPDPPKGLGAGVGSTSCMREPFFQNLVPLFTRCMVASIGSTAGANVDRGLYVAGGWKVAKCELRDVIYTFLFEWVSLPISSSHALSFFLD